MPRVKEINSVDPRNLLNQKSLRPTINKIKRTTGGHLEIDHSWKMFHNDLMKISDKAFKLFIYFATVEKYLCNKLIFYYLLFISAAKCLISF